MSPAGPRPSGRRARIPLAPAVIEIVGRMPGGVTEQRREAIQRLLAALLGRQRVERARIREAQQDARARVARADVERDEHRPLVGQRFTRAAVGAPERRLVGGVRLAQIALRPVLVPAFRIGRQRRIERDPARCAGGTATMTALAATSTTIRTDGQGAVGVPLDACARPRSTRTPLAELFGHPQRDLLRASRESGPAGRRPRRRACGRARPRP